MTDDECDAVIERMARDTGKSPREVALRLLLELDGQIAELSGTEPDPDSELALLAAIEDESA